MELIDVALSLLRESSMNYYDQLPKEIRQVLANADNDVNPETILRIYESFGFETALETAKNLATVGVEHGN